MWQNGIIAKVLDCSKILPVSESIPSMRNLSEISSFTTAGENNAPPAGIVNRSSSISAGMAQHPTAGGGHHHITAMSIVEVCGKSRNGSDTHKRLPANCFANEEELDHEQLIVGTNRGVLIVIQAREVFKNL
jgi:hypothetical protein